MASRDFNVELGATTAQDLLVVLGPPSRVHYKEDERMAIHSQSSTSPEIHDAGCKDSAAYDMS